MPTKKTLMIWESEVTRTGPKSVSITAKRPLDTMTRAQAAKVLGVSPWTVSNLFRSGYLTGHKPGARVIRKDGKASNATVRLDTASVLKYHQRQVDWAKAERES